MYTNKFTEDRDGKGTSYSAQVKVLLRWVYATGFQDDFMLIMLTLPTIRREIWSGTSVSIEVLPRLSGSVRGLSIQP